MKKKINNITPWSTTAQKYDSYFIVRENILLYAVVTVDSNGWIYVAKRSAATFKISDILLSC